MAYRLIATIEPTREQRAHLHPLCVAKVHKCSDTGDYRVRMYPDGTLSKVNPDTDGFESDREAAEGTARAMIARQAERAAAGVMRARVAALRKALRIRYGRWNYRITGHIGVTEEVHIYGRMPNSQTIGWWVMGDVVTAEAWLGLPAGGNHAPR